MLHSQREGFPPSSQLMHIAYSFSFPTCMYHSKKCAPSLLNSPSTSPLPFQGFNNKLDKNSQSTTIVVGLPLGENTFLASSLTWRELLTGLTICFIIPNKLSHLKKVAHRLDNLLLQSTLLSQTSKGDINIDENNNITQV